MKDTVVFLYATTLLSFITMSVLIFSLNTKLKKTERKFFYSYVFPRLRIGHQ